MKYIFVLIFSIVANAQGVITPYTLCVNEVNSLIARTQDRSTECKTKIFEGARCCAGAYPKCSVAGRNVPIKVGMNGNDMVEADKLNIEVLNEQKDHCKSGETVAKKNCSSTADDQQAYAKYNSAMKVVHDCLNSEMSKSAARIPASAETDANATAQCSGKMTEAQMLACLRKK